MLKRIGILVFDDVEELDFVGPLEVFGMVASANQPEIIILADAVMEVRCHYGLRILPSHSLAQCPPLDLLIVPGGPGARKHAREKPSDPGFRALPAGLPSFSLYRSTGPGCGWCTQK